MREEGDSGGEKRRWTITVWLRYSKVATFSLPTHGKARQEIDVLSAREKAPPAHLRRRRVAGGNCGKWWYPSDTHPTTAPDHIIHPITSSRVDSPTRTQNVPRRSYKGTLRVADIMDAHLDLTYTEFKKSQNVSHFGNRGKRSPRILHKKADKKLTKSGTLALVPETPIDRHFTQASYDASGSAKIIRETMGVSKVSLENFQHHGRRKATDARHHLHAASVATKNRPKISNLYNWVSAKAGTLIGLCFATTWPVVGCGKEQSTNDGLCVPHISVSISASNWGSTWVAPKPEDPLWVGVWPSVVFECRSRTKSLAVPAMPKAISKTVGSDSNQNILFASESLYLPVNTGGWKSNAGASGTCWELEENQWLAVHQSADHWNSRGAETQFRIQCHPHINPLVEDIYLKFEIVEEKDCLSHDGNTGFHAEHTSLMVTDCDLGVYESTFLLSGSLSRTFSVTLSRLDTVVPYFFLSRKEEQEEGANLHVVLLARVFVFHLFRQVASETD
ncbi:hypothetical protein C8J57DRAFT_1256986 [Mycena rebaudengoi]|nr:hypothetical protein C8J57DRAFT_1256986 [Mycena rebaudengoi]